MEVAWRENIQTMINCTQCFILQLPNSYIPLLHVQQIEHNVEDIQQKKTKSNFYFEMILQISVIKCDIRKLYNIFTYFLILI